MQRFTGITHDKLRPRVSYTAKGLWGVYIPFYHSAYSVPLVLKNEFFDAFCHGLSTISTGGFSTSDMSIAQWNSIYLKIVDVCVYVFLAV